MYRNDHDRANGENVLHRYYGTQCTVTVECTVEPVESS